MKKNQIVKKKLGRPRTDHRPLLIKSAISLFLEKGFHQTRIEDIVAKSSTGKGTFYLYFANKEQLVLDSLKSLAQELKETFDWVQTELPAETDLTSLFHQEALKIVSTLEENQELARFLFKEGRSVGHEIDSHLNQYYLNIIEQAENTYALGMHLGIIERGDPRVSAMCVLGSVLQVFHHYLEGQLVLKTHEIAKLVTQFCLRGLGLKEALPS